MSGSVNKVILVGNLGADPDIKRTQDGRAIVNLSVATSERWRDRQTGESREKTEWHRVVIFNEALAKTAEQYLRKGSKVYIEGQLQTRSWEDQTGQKRYATEVVLPAFGAALVLLDRADRPPAPSEDDYGARSPSSAAPSQATRRAGAAAQRPHGADAAGPVARAGDLDDEIPF